MEIMSHQRQCGGNCRTWNAIYKACVCVRDNTIFQNATSTDHHVSPYTYNTRLLNTQKNGTFTGEHSIAS